jgi:UDP-N-acetylglucosamine 2-epimerase
MKIASIVGARPQFIKIAPLCREFKKQKSIKHLIIHTDQHYDYNMSKAFFDELEIPNPDYHLEVGAGTHGYQTGEMMKRVENVLIKERPDWAMVYGDTNSTLAGALAATKIDIPLAHVEAGLRSYNKKMPEEINRLLTDHISDLLFCPTKTAMRNLKQEGLEQGVHSVGDVMYDSVLYNVELAENHSQLLEKLHLKPKNYALATVHRAENTDNPDRLRAIFNAFQKIAEKSIPIIIPLHPRTRKQMQLFRVPVDSLQIIEPVQYLDMLLLQKQARIVVTDSGGIQKEAFFLHVPCITLRGETEWVETVEAGWNMLVDIDEKKIVLSAQKFRNPSHSVGQEAFGDGRAAKKIVSIFLKLVDEI